MTQRLCRCFAFAALLAISHSAQAGFLNPTGAITIIPAPSDTSPGALESNTEIRAFAERQSVLLAANLPVDITVPGTSPQGGVPNLSSGSIAAGITVNSFLLHFDSLAGTVDPVSVTGSISFTEDILGIAVLSDTLDSTDAIAGLLGLTYPSGNARGLELNAGDTGIDGITLSADRRTVSVNLLNLNATEQVRIITAVPEPSSISLAAIASFGLLAWSRRRFRRGATPSR